MLKQYFLQNSCHHYSVDYLRRLFLVIFVMKTNTLIKLTMGFFIGFVCQDTIANTPAYKAGKFAVLSEYCGIFEDSNKLFLKYAKGNFQQKEEFVCYLIQKNLVK